ncbi:MAG: NADH-quinone oxidoreductase subunit NuoG [Corynebacterium sp.]|nr:NADH-quinone oxidoreductase subunit NuoG [Corynebacterium sp.]
MTNTPADQEMVTLTIDGREVSVPKGTMVIRAAEQAGIDIPRFCDHPLLEPVAACRQCLVDVPDAGNGRGFPKPQHSCSLEAMNGMVVETQHTSENVAKTQAGIMELLLINHPLDCPICDKGGECPLQNQAMSAGRGQTRFDGPKREFPTPIDLVGNILLDRERCVLCTRCTRFDEQIAGDNCISLAQRGARQQISSVTESEAGSYFSGNVVQICPVGALTSSDYRFQARPFDLVSTDSTCENCATGCALRVDHRHGHITRRLAGEDDAVNLEWSCDKGRFGFKYLERTLTAPLARVDGQLQEVTWTQALNIAAEALATAGQSVGVIAPNTNTVENTFAYGEFARTLGSTDYDFRTDHATAEETAFLRALVAGDNHPVAFADLDTAQKVVLVAFEPEDEAGVFFLRLRSAVRKNGLEVVTVSSHASLGSAKLHATVELTQPGGEPAALTALEGVDEQTIILVGSRATDIPGLYQAVAEKHTYTGARVAWIPAHAGDRGALEAGLLPEAGKSTPEILQAAAHGELQALVLGLFDDADYADRDLLAAAQEKAFTIQLTPVRTRVSEHADVVFPVRTIAEVNGHFINWENRWRPVHALTGVPVTRLSDRKVLSEIARTMGIAFALPKNAEIAATVQAAATGVAGGAVTATATRLETPQSGELVLDSWPELLGESLALSGSQFVGSDHRRAHARISAATAARIGVSDDDSVTVTAGSTAITVPVHVTETMAEDVVWLPTNIPGQRLNPAAGARVGATVTARPATDNAHLAPHAAATESTESES